MSLELDREMEQVIASELQPGRSKSAEEFVTRAVKHFVIARELGEEWTTEEIDAKIERGLVSLRCCDVVDGELFFDQLEADLDRIEKARGGQ